MKYEIRWQKKATKQLFKLPADAQSRIVAAVGRLADSETWGDVRKLVNHEYDYRLRIGNYRILFNATADLTVEVNDISVEEIKKRDDRTY